MVNRPENHLTKNRRVDFGQWNNLFILNIQFFQLCHGSPTLDNLIINFESYAVSTYQYYIGHDCPNDRRFSGRGLIRSLLVVSMTFLIFEFEFERKHEHYNVEI